MNFRGVVKDLGENLSNDSLDWVFLDFFEFGGERGEILFGAGSFNEVLFETVAFLSDEVFVLVKTESLVFCCLNLCSNKSISVNLRRHGICELSCFSNHKRHFLHLIGLLAFIKSTKINQLLRLLLRRLKLGKYG